MIEVTATSVPQIKEVYVSFVQTAADGDWHTLGEECTRILPIKIVKVIG